MMLLFTK